MTTTPLVLTQMISSRRRSTVWWSVGMAVLVVGIASAYPSARDSGAGLESYMDSLPEGVVELFGATAGIGTPVGYLNSQLYANVLPLLLIVMGVGAGSWAVAGAEADGTLEMLLANPVTRTRVAVERLLGLVILTGALALVATVVAVAVAPAFGLEDIGAGALAGAGLAAWLLALVFASVSFAVGAATGSKPAAMGTGAGLAAGTYVLFGLTGFVDQVSALKWVSPWFWFLDADPLAGVTSAFWWEAVALPLAVCLLVCLGGIARLVRRDLH